MKKAAITIAALALTGAGSLKAQLSARSHTDSFGNTTAYFSNGVSARSSTDSFGNTTTYYSNGVSSRSSVDSFGNRTTYFNGTSNSAPTQPRRGGCRHAEYAATAR